MTRALPDVEHHVHFLSPPCPETEVAFSSSRITAQRPIDPDQIARAEADVVILHNVSPRGWPGVSVPTIQYVHSAGARATADTTVYCSLWLAGQCGRVDDATVLYQAVPKPAPTSMGPHRTLRKHLVVGRLCTPSTRKWPMETVGFYERLAGQFPCVEWEFVGCPEPMRSELMQACRGRAEFIDAGWSARSRLWHLDALLYHHPHLAESFGRTCAESMRSGCVPIVDRRGGFVEQVTPETGFLCDNEADFVRALAQLHNAGLRRRMSRSSMTHADGAFSLQRFRSDLLRLLRTLASITR